MSKPVRRYETAGGIVVHESSVLLLDRPERGELRLPKGHIDPGEDAQKAALREVREETGYVGLTIIHDLGTRLNRFEYQGDIVERTETFYLMMLHSMQQAPQSDEDSQQFYPFWVLLDEAPSRLTFEFEREFARAAQFFLQGSTHSTNS